MDIKDKIKLLKKVKLKNFKSSNLDIEIIGDIEEIDGGIQLFAKAFKNGKQLGFGKDGSIEIERFRFFNPPTSIRDGNDIILNPEQAIKDSLIHTVSLVGKEDTNIVKGKIGNTTSTFYGYSGDGPINVSNSNYTTAHNATSGTSGPTASSEIIGVEKPFSTYKLSRGFFVFVTSSLGTDTIDSATFSVYSSAKYSESGTGDAYFAVVDNSQASSTIVDGDYDTLGTTKGATDITYASWSTSAYNNYALNATGLSWIDPDGFSYFGMRDGHDIANSATNYNKVTVYFSEQSGTSNDPKLVVEHTASATDNSLFFGNNF